MSTRAQGTEGTGVGTPNGPPKSGPPPYPAVPYSLTSNWVLKTCSCESSNLAMMVHVPRLEEGGDRVRGQGQGRGCAWAILGGGAPT